MLLHLGGSLGNLIHSPTLCWDSLQPVWPEHLGSSSAHFTAQCIVSLEQRERPVSSLSAEQNWCPLLTRELHTQSDLMQVHKKNSSIGPGSYPAAVSEQGSISMAPFTTEYCTQSQPSSKPGLWIQATTEPIQQPYVDRNQASSPIQLVSAMEPPQPQSLNSNLTPE